MRYTFVTFHYYYSNQTLVIMMILSLFHFIFQTIFFINLHCSDEKAIDFAEQLESVAYVLCGEDPIIFEKFISIWNARGVSGLI